jgi:hypothetical protein
VRLLLQGLPLPSTRTAATLAWVDANREDIVKRGFEIVYQPHKDGVDPWLTWEETLREEWARGQGILTLSPYVVPCHAMILEGLARCSQEICFVPHEEHQAFFPHRPRWVGTSCSAHLCDPTMSAAVYIGEGGITRSIETFDTRAHRANFGLIKFGARLAEVYPKFDIPPGPPGEGALEGRFWEWLRSAGKPYFAHIHWPGGEPGKLLENHHYKCAGDV